MIRRPAKALWVALRPQQWVKNLLLFVPVLLDHRLFDVPLIGAAIIAFCAWSLVASGGYVLNDLLDAEADRMHPQKQHRPFAAGELSRTAGAVLLPILVVIGFALAVPLLPFTFVALLGLYLATTVAYSLHLKRVAVLDVIVLAGLYTLRVLAGIAATGVRFSAWLLVFSMFIFLSLAFLKRFAELAQGRTAEGELVARRGYMRGDLPWLGSMGSASGYMAVLVLALYINSEEVTRLYGTPALLWLICPPLLFWVSRMWLLAHRDRIHEDPLIATARDPVSYLVAIAVGIVLLVAL